MFLHHLLQYCALMHGFVLCLLDVYQIDGNAHFKNELYN